jgi:cobalt-zinc-cadmium efflux system protein
MGDHQHAGEDGCNHAHGTSAGNAHDHAHDNAHDHGHSHAHGSHAHGLGHSHAHAPANFGRAFVIGIVLNVIFVVVEAGYGLWGNSVALLADAGHNLGDVLGLLAAFTASILSSRAPSARFTYGFRSSSILAALFNAVFLLLTVGAISLEAIQRIADPEPVSGGTVMVVAAIGILINGFCAWLFASGRKDDLNVRGAFLHMASDAIVSAGVVVAGFIVLLTHCYRIDPIVSLLVNAVIVWGTWGLLSDSLKMSMDAVPSHIEPADVRRFLLEQAGVASVHDLHIWSMSTTEVALTCHVVMPAGHPGDGFLKSLSNELMTHFKIAHATVQIELDPQSTCHLAPDHVV